MFWCIFLGSVRWRWRRVALAAAAMAAGTSAVAALLNLGFGMRHRMAEEADAFGATAVILPGPAEGGPVGSSFGPTAEPARMSPDVSQRLHRLLERRQIAACQLLYATASLAGSEVVVVGAPWTDVVSLNRGWDVKRLHPSFDSAIWRDAPPRPGEAIPALVGDDLWRSIDASPGNRLPLAFPGLDAEIVISGRVRTGGDEDAQIFLPLDRLQTILGWPGALSAIPIRAQGGEAEIRRLADAVEELAPGWTVQTSLRTLQARQNLLRRLEVLLGITALAILIGSILAVTATTLATVLDRTREVGLLRALGGGGRLIRAQFLMEGALTGSAGAMVGLIAGWAGAAGIARTAFGANLGLSFWVVPIVFGVGLGASLVGVLIPLGRALRIDPVICLRSDR